MIDVIDESFICAPVVIRAEWKAKVANSKYFLINLYASQISAVKSAIQKTLKDA